MLSILHKTAIAFALIILSNISIASAQKIGTLEEEKLKVELIAASSKDLSNSIEKLDNLLKNLFGNKPKSDREASALLVKTEALNDFKKEFTAEKDSSIVLLSSFSLSLQSPKELNENFIVFQLQNICWYMPGFKLYDSRFINNPKELDSYKTIKLDYAKQKLSANEFSYVEKGLEQQIKLAQQLNIFCKRITDAKNW